MLLPVACLALLTVAALAQDGAGKGKAELKLELPKPMFVGTPKNIKTANLEKPRKGKRPPVFLPEGCTNLALDKDVTSSDEEPVLGDVEQITDGDKEGNSCLELGPGKQWVQIDLDTVAEIHAIVLWHFHSQARVYRDIVVQTAADPDFIMDVKTVYNNDHDNSAGLGVGRDKEYIETYEGRIISVKAVKGRYVRLFSNGSTSNDMNHYIEVEIHGKSIK
ncbi:MAG: hypothetical protein KAI66_06615 [Lentisphaeria bacterium]|nr:hypothetical protein [Lentisphaeria bacterium]